jgi:hypothetical protein
MSVKVLVRSTIPVQWPNFGWARAAVDTADLHEAFRLMMELLRPASLVAFLLAAWRLSSDLGWSNQFLFSEGLLYHWQVWVALGFAMLGVWHRFSNSVAKH